MAETEITIHYPSAEQGEDYHPNAHVAEVLAEEEKPAQPQDVEKTLLETEQFLTNFAGLREENDHLKQQIQEYEAQLENLTAELQQCQIDKQHLEQALLQEREQHKEQLWTLRSELQKAQEDRLSWKEKYLDACMKSGSQPNNNLDNSASPSSSPQTQSQSSPSPKRIVLGGKRKRDQETIASAPGEVEYYANLESFGLADGQEEQQPVAITMVQTSAKEDVHPGFGASKVTEQCPDDFLHVPDIRKYDGDSKDPEHSYSVAKKSRRKSNKQDIKSFRTKFQISDIQPVVRIEPLEEVAARFAVFKEARKVPVRISPAKSKSSTVKNKISLVEGSTPKAEHGISILSVVTESPQETLVAAILADSFGAPASDFSAELRNSKVPARPNVAAEVAPVELPSLNLGDQDEQVVIEEDVITGIFSEEINQKLLCETCGKLFTSDSKLKQHLLFHTENRPFICEICHETFKIRAFLHTHMKSKHSTTKTFKCDHCGACFGWKAALYTHTKTKHGEGAKFTCDLCKKDFAWKSSYQAHLKHHEQLCDFSYSTEIPARAPSISLDRSLSDRASDEAAGPAARVGDLPEGAVVLPTGVILPEGTVLPAGAIVLSENALELSAGNGVGYSSENVVALSSENMAALQYHGVRLTTEDGLAFIPAGCAIEMTESNIELSESVVEHGSAESCPEEELEVGTEDIADDDLTTDDARVLIMEESP